jgi:hypothetical protein
MDPVLMHPAEPPKPPPSLRRLSIPDELLAWAREPERRIGWSIDYAADIDRLLAGRRPMPDAARRALLSRLEGLVGEAVRAGRHDLLLGLDAATAALLGLRYGFEVQGRRVTLGSRPPEDRSGEWWTFGEVETIREAGEDAYEAARAAKAVLAEVFEDATVEAVEREPRACASCGATDASAMVATTHGTEHCAKCWRALTVQGVNHVGSTRGRVR